MMKSRQDSAAARRRDRIWTIVLVGVFLVGLLILLYPTVSNWWNARVQTRAVAAYDAAATELTDSAYAEYLAAAEAYNERLAEIGSAEAIVSPELVEEGYEELLDISDTGVMGYVTIAKINVQLPIYHGTDSAVLQVGAGHLEGSSLPVGGESTHSVISAHRGLPSSLLFTNLDKLELGDTFTVTVLNRVLTYQVDRISVVLPDELENLYIEEEKDYCTLMTCTPYGINSHRLLVRGVRVGDSEEAVTRVSANEKQMDLILVASAAAVPLLLLVLVGLLLNTRRRKKREANHDE
ncbi:MAG: class C sortase [Lachnospiraceae bacterium]|nr:class C sortase [Lachnospiraceae bacterium]